MLTLTCVFSNHTTIQTPLIVTVPPIPPLAAAARSTRKRKKGGGSSESENKSPQKKMLRWGTTRVSFVRSSLLTCLPPNASKVVQDIEHSPHKKRQPSQPGHKYTTLKGWAMSLRGMEFKLKGSFWNGCDEKDKNKLYESKITKTCTSTVPIEFEFEWKDAGGNKTKEKISYASVLEHVGDDQRDKYYLPPSYEAAKEEFDKMAVSPCHYYYIFCLRLLYSSIPCTLFSSFITPNTQSSECSEFSIGS